MAKNNSNKKPSLIGTLLTLLILFAILEPILKVLAVLVVLALLGALVWFIFSASKETKTTRVANNTPAPPRNNKTVHVQQGHSSPANPKTEEVHITIRTSHSSSTETISEQLGRVTPISKLTPIQKQSLVIPIPDEIDIFIQFGYSTSKKFNNAVCIIKNLANYKVEGEGKNVLHSCHFTNIEEFLSAYSDISRLLDIIDKWKKTRMTINGTEKRYKDYLLYRYNLEQKFPQYNPIFDRVCTLTTLPLPYMYHFDTFYAFAREIDSPVYFCSCQEKAIHNYLRLRSSMPLSSFFNYSEIKKYITPANLLFRDNLCFKCNDMVSKGLDHGAIHKAGFSSYFERDIRAKYFEFGLDPNNLQINELMLHDCPSDIYQEVSKYEQLRNQQHTCSDSDLLSEIAEQISAVENSIETKIENIVRDEFGYQKKGRWVSESTLYYIVSDIYSEETIMRNYRPKWLAGLELDIYIPGKQLAFEYQGIQHFEPVEHWGGKQQLAIQQEHDKRKANICQNRGIH